MGTGRPFYFKSEEELESKINEYWDYCELNERPKTYSGLAYYLGVTRQTLFNYGNREKYAHIIERAKACIEMDTEERLQIAGQPTAGIIFSLKNNFEGWSDKHEIKADVEANNNNKVSFNNLTTDEIKELLKNE